MTNVKIQNKQWTKMVRFLRSCAKVYVGQEEQCRQFIEAVLWIARSGAPWHFLPEKYGNWNSVYKRFARWCDHGVWQQMHHHFADDPDMESILSR